jgi:DNA polymerase-3 subunit epsilon
LATLKNANNAFKIMRKNFENKNGVSNPFVSWHEDLLDVLEVMLRLVPHESLIAALRHLALNVRKHSSGLPDLFIWNVPDYRFIEIKAENDHLSGHQYEWLRVMAEAGINVSLEKVERPAHALPDQELQAANV